MEHILRFLFPQVVDEQNGDAVLVRQPLQHRQIPVVIGVGGVVYRADHLKCVNDDQHDVRMFPRKCVHLFLQSLANGSTFRTEVDAVRSLLGDFKEPILDAEDRIFQAEIEGSAPLHAHSPD